MSASVLKLYEATDALEYIRSCLWEAEGELTPEIEELLAKAEGDFSAKVERVALFIREQLGQAKIIKEEEERLCQRRKRYERTAESLKAYLQRELERADTKKVEGRLINVRLQANPPKMVLAAPLSENDLRNLSVAAPELVRHVPESFTLDARAVVDAWKEGKLPASLVPQITVEQGVSVRFS